MKSPVPALIRNKTLKLIGVFAGTKCILSLFIIVLPVSKVRKVPR